MADLAGRQHGVVSARQLAELGCPRNTVAKWTRAGRLHRLHRGVYAVGHDALAWEGRCMGAVLASAPAVTSHWTAAWLWGLLRTRPGTFHVTCPTRRHTSEHAVVHFAHLVRADLRRVGGIPATAVERTLLDLAPKSTPRQLENMLDRAEGKGVFDRRRVDALLARTRGHRGQAPLIEALRIYKPKARVQRSGLERRFLALVEAAGLPLPATNYIVGPYEVDCWWEAERFAVELDVFATHGSPLAFERDRERDDDLLAIGVEVVHITDVRLESEPDAVMARIAAHLGRRREQLAAARYRPLLLGAPGSVD